MKPLKFIFDLDGTLTKKETLPLIANHFKINFNDTVHLTQKTVEGKLDFEYSLIKRVNFFKELPIDKVENLLSKVELYPQLIDFISNNINNCVIATSNLDVWVRKLVDNIGCKYFLSNAQAHGNQINRITYILDKKKVVLKYQADGNIVVFIGDGYNDIEAMIQADLSIAAGMTHIPSEEVLTICDHAFFTEKDLTVFLNTLISH